MSGQSIGSSNRQHHRIVSFLSDYGPKCSSSKEIFIKTLTDIGIPLDEIQVAEIVTFVLHASGSHDDIILSDTWNLEAIAEVLAQHCQGLNWALTVQRLDQPNLYIRSEQDFHLLTRFFVRISGKPMPAAGLMRLWNNRAAQLALLILGAKAPRNIVDFSALVTADQIMGNEVPSPPNFSWVSLPIYAVLLELASTMQIDVLEAFASAAASYPEYVLIGLAQVLDPSTGVRAEILRRTLPLFTGLAGSRPTSMKVMKRLQAANPELLVLLFRIALKRSNTVQDIVEVDARLRNVGGDIPRRVEEEGTVEELLGYWCVRADKSDLNLEEWTTAVLERNPQLARSFVSFAKAHAEYLRPRGSEGGLLSYESFAILVRAVHAYQNIVTMDELRALSSIFSQQQLLQQQQQQRLLHAQQMQQQQQLQLQQHQQHIGDQSDMNALDRPQTSPEIEKEANAYFQKIYTSDLTILDVINMLKRFKTSEKPREQDIFRCMIHNLFDEYRFFHKYPDKELQVTGCLFGTLIQHQLVSSITLGVALRYVLEAVRKDPTEQGGSGERMFRFGKIALDQFRHRFSEWPQYCSHLVQIPHFGQYCPELYNEAQRAINAPTPTPTPSGSFASTTPVPTSSQPLVAVSPVFVPAADSSELARKFSPNIEPVPVGLTAGNAGNKTISYSPAPVPNVDAAQVLSQQMSDLDLNPQRKPVPDAVVTASPVLRVVSAGAVLPPVAALPLAASQPAPVKDTLPVVDGPVIAAATPLPAPAVAVIVAVEEVAVRVADTAPHLSVIERMLESNPSTDQPNLSLPPDSARDQILFIVNNIAKDNCLVKTEELRHVLIVDYFNWFANYLVVKRISTMPNLHPIYLTVLEILESSDLFKAILDVTYHHTTKLLSSPNITTSSSERSLLRNLGVWLGQITLARNKPLLQRRINLKELLIWGYETARLIAVCSFVAKIIEGCKDSKIFRPPNPWLMAILGVMRELYEIEDLKMNIKFEVQVLCKHANIKIEDIPRGNALSRCVTPIKDGRNPDFTVKPGAAAASPMIQSSPSMNASAGSASAVASISSVVLPPAALSQEDAAKSLAAGEASAASTAAALAASQEQTVIPNLASYVTINPALLFFVNNPAQRRLVALAVDRAIREVIQPVVERSVTIASVTTKQLVLKDFSSEPNEQHLRSGAHLMIAHLAGSLALVTCKEPLRTSIGNHLRTLLATTTADAATVDQIIQTCAAENLELGCILIEKASSEKATRDVDEALATAIQMRRKIRESGQPFVDTIAAAAAVDTANKYPRELPDQLKPHPGGLLPQQFLVYDAFQRARLTPPSVQAQSADNSPVPTQPGAGNAVDIKTQLLPPAAGQAQVGQSLSSVITSNAMLSMSQAIEAYQLLLARLDNSLKTVQVQAQGREVSIAMLGGDHEILTFLRDMITVAHRTQVAVRAETAMSFCENVFKRLMDSVNVSPDALRLEVMIGIIDALRDACGGAKKFAPDVISWLGLYATFNVNDEMGRKIHRAVLLLLLRAKLLRTTDVDVYFATYMDGGRNIAWVELALTFIRQCLSEGIAATFEFSQTFDTVSKIRPPNPAVRKQLQKWLTDLRALATSKDEQQQQKTAVAPQPIAPVSRDATVREHVTVLLERWLRVWNSTNDQVFGQYLQLMHQYGVLKTEEAADRFFRIAAELCVEACLKSGSQQAGEAGVLTFTVVDALSKLFLLLVRLADKEAGNISVRVNLLNRILNAIARTLLDDHEAKKIAKLPFDQRPYFRLLSNLSQDLGVPEPKADPNPVIVPLLTAYCQVYLALQPSVLPGFAYSWLQLISHRSFMPHLLQAKGQKCWPLLHRLLMAMLLFLHPFLKSAQMNDAVRRLYKGTLRVLLVLLHDFPEFLCDFHLSFCEAIPTTCVQLRNLVLSAFPRSLRLPDPFTPNLKVDLLPEISQPPRILTDYLTVLTERGIRPQLESFLATRQPAELPAMLASLVSTLNSSSAASLLTSVVVHVATLAIAQQQSKVPLQSSHAVELFKQLGMGLTAEGRYHFFNAMANQLRYPNSHTHYFSCVLLCLFAEADNEFFQEQITRVLLERLIVHRPHPWGLLITFIELIKNPRYNFWRKSFTKCAPELERVFDSVARSCMGTGPPGGSGVVQPQLTQPVSPKDSL